MLFFIQNTLIQLRTTPAIRDVELKQLRELGRRLRRIGVSPGPETAQELSVLIERQIPVHHGADSDGCQIRKLRVILFLYIRRQIPVTILYALMNILQGIGPNSLL